MSIRAIASVIVVSAVLTTGAAGGVTQVVQLVPAQDASLPFWCDWGYDWDERCYRDDADRLPVGGDDDKVWRAALRFATSSIPSGATVVRATLKLFHDGVCLAPRKSQRPCDARPYALSAHPILSPDWFRERELDFGDALSEAEIDSADRAQELAFDVTGVVAEWIAGTTRNSGVLVKLTEDYEDLGASGPRLPSSTFAQGSSRPRLEVTYMPP